MNIVLLDDVGSHNAQLKQAILDICRRENLPAEIALEATRFEQVLEYAASNPPLTVYFLDIRLDQEKTGLDVCRLLRRDEVRDRCVFVSAYPHYALDCLRVHAYDLLLKPVSMSDLRDCLLSLYRELQMDGSAMLDIPIGSRVVRLPISGIYFLEAQGRNVVAHTVRGDYTWQTTMAHMEEMLSDYDFVRIHRKYLANRAHVQEWDTAADTIVVHGQTLPFARRARKVLAREGS